MKYSLINSWCFHVQFTQVIPLNRALIRCDGSKLRWHNIDTVHAKSLAVTTPCTCTVLVLDEGALCMSDFSDLKRFFEEQGKPISAVYLSALSFFPIRIHVATPYVISKAIRPSILVIRPSEYSLNWDACSWVNNHFLMCSRNWVVLDFQ